MPETRPWRLVLTGKDWTPPSTSCRGVAWLQSPFPRGPNHPALLGCLPSWPVVTGFSTTRNPRDRTGRQDRFSPAPQSPPGTSEAFKGVRQSGTDRRPGENTRHLHSLREAGTQSNELLQPAWAKQKTSNNFHQHSSCGESSFLPVVSYTEAVSFPQAAPRRETANKAPAPTEPRPALAPAPLHMLCYENVHHH